ncbi:Molybdenum cofactor biosynthesis protein MoaA [Paramagnetospirillum magnetotacticum MS-1]|uniref:Molybdenum cofactor biosynthesis protein MoaA n=1 Tax=Paramagnetospirillum magnetotacticum MS-1 TaxID=272627 RepID=A0A0C2YD40_PARME|nr:radical SAM protein [Paramagnetospirillum magnetotacticum]KIL97594.1 Molybdenum cofactor biosynthesis protein MoaA [Paramagnetospirillum magnetotacticum MS-1]
MPTPRPWLYLGTTHALCEDCLALIPAKVVAEDGCVWHLKRCPAHGPQRTMISSDYAYWREARDFIKPGDLPAHFHTQVDKGCPHDCGLCPDHEQHSCLALVEVTDSCGLDCPTCFAQSRPGRGHRSLAEVEAMLDAVVRSEGGSPDIVQISGGEPADHPQILEILRAAKARPIRHVMLNTNGVRLARDPDFATALAGLGPGFEVYLQWDSLEPEALSVLRGADLREVRKGALAALDRHGISTTLVCVMAKGVNDGEVGAIIDHALAVACVRGVSFQPLQDAGRSPGLGKDSRMLPSDIRRAIIEQSNGLFGPADLVPLPCNPESITIAYALRHGNRATAVTGLVPRDLLLSAVPNALTFDAVPGLKDSLMRLLSMSCAGEDTAVQMGKLLCCLPGIQAPASLTYDKVFRLSIVQFLDRYSFCLGQVKRACVHVAQPDGKMIPIDTFNLFHRSNNHD